MNKLLEMTFWYMVALWRRPTTDAVRNRQIDRPSETKLIQLGLLYVIFQSFTGSRVCICASHQPILPWLLPPAAPFPHHLPFAWFRIYWLLFLFTPVSRLNLITAKQSTLASGLNAAHLIGGIPRAGHVSGSMFTTGSPFENETYSGLLVWLCLQDCAKA